jgi:SAM-dependent methyltransferase
VRSSTDYDRVAPGYTGFRQTDPRIEARVHAALADSRTILNVGAGAGSYEPRDRWVLAVEPSAGMRAQRPPGAAPAIDGRAEGLPLDDGAVDAAMAMITVHHWDDPIGGLAELRRVASRRVVVLTFDMAALAPFWLVGDYAPEILAADGSLFPTIDVIADALGGARVEPVPIPIDCADGFIEAYYARPEGFLDPEVRAAQSVWGRVSDGVVERMAAELERDLADGTWEDRNGHLRSQPEYDGALRLIVKEL